MTLNEYQTLAMRFRKPSANVEYAFANLAGEAGEVLSLHAKSIRDGTPEGYLDNLRKELGDVMWQIAAIADSHGMTLKEIATTNLNKLEGRQARNTISGNGDNR